jgi:hypothetical protein
MPRSLIPPRGVYVSSQVVYHPDMPAHLKETLIQLIGLAWGSPTDNTPPITYKELANLTGKSEFSLYGHIENLRSQFNALSLHQAHRGYYVFALDKWVVPAKSGQALLKIFKNANSIKEEEESIKDENHLESPPPPPDSDQEGEREGKPRKFSKTFRKVRKKKQRKSTREEGRELSPDLTDALVAAGIFKGLLGEIRASTFSEEALRALLEWTEDDRPGNAAALFIGRLRAGAVAPQKYFVAPCTRCGQRGGHAQDCSKRFHEGEYADFIEH